MQNVIIDKPYRFVPPYRGRFWTKLMSAYLRRAASKRYGIERITCEGVEHLKSSLSASHGILLTPNHCRDCDPLVLGQLAREARTPLFLMASWHVFMQGKIMAWALRRGGAFSIYREGMDKAALSTATEILESAERPLVIFPEGVVSRANDRLNALMEGTALIARSAAKKRAKTDPSKKVVVHPIAIRYHFEGNLEQSITPVLNDIEHRISWQPQSHLNLVDRIYKLGEALLALKELEFIGSAQAGPIQDRLDRLINHILNPLEDRWAKSQHDGTTVARVKRLRSAILPDMVKGELSESERQDRWRQLAEMYLAQQLSLYPPDYVKTNPTPDRILETVERFEEDLTDNARIHRPMSAHVTVAPAIEVPAARSDGDTLMDQIEKGLRTALGIDAQ